MRGILLVSTVAPTVQPAHCAGPKRLIILSKTWLGLAKGFCWHLVANGGHPRCDHHAPPGSPPGPAPEPARAVARGGPAAEKSESAL